MHLLGVRASMSKETYSSGGGGGGPDPCPTPPPLHLIPHMPKHPLSFAKTPILLTVKQKTLIINLCILLDFPL